MAETIENVNEYHGVWAGSLVTIMNILANRPEEKDANRLMRFCIRFAFVQYQENLDPTISYENIVKLLDGMELENKDAKQLTSMLAFYQAKAKMKSVQTSDGKARLWQRLRGRL